MPILKKKTLPPKSHQSYVNRQIVQEILNEEFPVTALTAPAGYGKTSVAKQTYERWHGHRAWITIDDTGCQLVEFLTYLEHASGVELDHKSASQRSEEIDIHLAIERIDEIMSVLLNDSELLPFLLIIEDIHYLYDSPVAALIFRLHEIAGDRFSLILTSRQPLPTGYAKSCMSGHVCLKGVSDLMFSNDEAIALFNHAAIDKYSLEAVQAMCSQVDGWPAGLQLVNLNTCHDAQTTVFCIKETPLAYDYIYSEIFQDFSPELQSFVKQTAMVDQFNTALVVELTGKSEAEVNRHITGLLHQGAFLKRVPNRDGWYEYSKLLSSFLRQVNEAELPESEICLHYQRASHWMRANGYLELAVDYGIASKNVDLVVALLSAFGWDFYNQGSLSVFKKSFEFLGLANISKDIDLAILFCWYFKVGERSITRTKRIVNAARSAIAQNTHLAHEKINEVLVLDLMAINIKVEEGNLDGSIETLQRIYKHYSDTEHQRLAYAYSVHATVQHNVGDLSGALAHSKRAELIDSRQNATLGMIWHMYMQASIYTDLGELSVANEVLQHAFELIETSSLEHVPKMDYLCFAQATNAYALLRHDIALRFAEKGLQHCKNWPHYQLAHLTNRLAVAIITGNRKLASDSFEQAERLVVKNETSTDIVARFCWFALQYLYREQLPVPMWLKKFMQLQNSMCLRTTLLQTLARAKYVVHFGGNCDEVDAVLKLAEATQFTYMKIQGHVLQCVRYFKINHKAAKTHLAKALALAEQGNICAPFAEVQDLLTDIDINDVTHTSSQRALFKRALSSQRKVKSRKGKNGGAINPQDLSGLTDREWEILSGLSLSIGHEHLSEKMFISVNTLKTHLRKIYRKLGVLDKKGAIEAREELAAYSTIV